nr:uncharacterized protein LOC127310031 [Lolium perenne]
MVVAKFWKYFKRAEGKENACDDVLHQLARKRVTGMHYEARIQCVRDWHADRFVHMSKEDARDTLMQPWQYLQNPPQYVGNDDRCFRAMVMWWTCPQYLKKHEEGKEKRAEMRGGSHIQGSIPISLHLQKEEVRTGAKPNVFAVLKKMKQRKTPDPETGSVWVNPQSETQCTSYVSKFKQKYGEEANPEAEDFDPEVAVLAGEGLKHGRLWFGDGCVDPARVPSLRQIRRGRKSGQPEVEPRPRASDLAVERLREEMAAKEQAAQEQRAQMEQQILQYRQQQTHDDAADPRGPKSPIPLTPFVTPSREHAIAPPSDVHAVAHTTPSPPSVVSTTSSPLPSSARSTCRYLPSLHLSSLRLGAGRYFSSLRLVPGSLVRCSLLVLPLARGRRSPASPKMESRWCAAPSASAPARSRPRCVRPNAAGAGGALWSASSRSGRAGTWRVWVAHGLGCVWVAGGARALNVGWWEDEAAWSGSVA